MYVSIIKGNKLKTFWLQLSTLAFLIAICYIYMYIYEHNIHMYIYNV